MNSWIYSALKYVCVLNSVRGVQKHNRLCVIMKHIMAIMKMEGGKNETRKREKKMNRLMERVAGIDGD